MKKRRLASLANKKTADRLRLYAKVFNANSEGILITDHKGKIISVNPAFTSITGYSENEIIGKNPNVLKSDLQGNPFYIEMWESIHSTGVWQSEIWNRRKNGEVYPEWLTINTVWDDNGNITNYVGIFSDVSEHRKVEEKLRLHAKVFEIASEGILITDIKGTILSINPAFSATTGYTEEEAVGKTPRILFSGIQNTEFYIRLWASIHSTGVWQGEIWNRRKNGEVYLEWLTVNAVRDESDKIAYYIGIFSDITERKQAEDQLKYLAHYDTLTGLPNRRLFYERLNQAITHAQRMQTMIGLLFIDLDRFKMINDTLGHAIGDELLVHMAKLLKNCVSNSDTVCRLGGDEFTIVLPNILQLEDAVKVAQNIIKEICQPFSINEHELFVTTSIGISIYPLDGEDIETLIKNADSAMYRAKEQSNNYQIYSSNLNETFSRKMELENGLRKALEKEQMNIYYQPQMNMKTGRITGMEALLRWRHPKLGMIPPTEFIPLAEDNGLIVEIGEFVLRTVCRQIQLWQSADYPVLKVFVNFSPRQLQKKNIVRTIKRILHETGVNPGSLGIEITESISIHYIDSIIQIMREFRELGVEVAIDDFGTGHSSLSYLRKFPIDTLKIDKSFIKDIDVDPAITKAIIDLAHNLKLHVIAEGVETKEQMAVLKKLRCDSIQGYLLSKPLPEEEISNMFTKDRMKMM